MEASMKTDTDDGIALNGGGPAPAGASQTLTRGLDILQAVAVGTRDLAGLAASLGTTRSTTHRLAMALVDRRYLNFVPRVGYSLGPKLLELGFRAQQDAPVVRVARPFLVQLAESCEDTVHLGILDDDRALYLDKIPGRRRIEISSRIGERHPVGTTGLGKALILDMDEDRWRQFYALGPHDAHAIPEALWLERMRDYAKRGIAFDLEENEAQIRCVAAPIRDATGAIVAAFSISSAAQYMADARMEKLASTARDVATAISRAMGWSGRR
jgi:DNA-binding IclR family transcriptional regulator